MKKTKAANPLVYMQELNVLRNVLHKAELLQNLDARLTKYLPNDLRPYCKVANFLEQRLILVAANASVATAIRLESFNLLQAFRKDEMLKNIHTIQCKVAPAPKTMRTTKRASQKMQRLSEQTSAIMQEIAETISDPELKKSLLNLTKHVTKKI